MGKEILKLSNISKIYENGIIANKDINLSVNKGEIHALVGENGAGKSTLMKIIFGMEKPTSGEFLLKNEPVNFSSVEEAIQKGIGMVHQHFMLINSLDIVDNVMLGVEKTKGLFLDKHACIKIVKEIADKYNFRLDYDKKVSDISIGMKQKVEIIKTLVRGAEIIILDEPTAVLTPQETEELFIQIKALAKSGHTIIFISHKLNEVKEISDKITIIRKGESKGTYLTKDIDVSEIADLMVGKKLNSAMPVKNKSSENKVVELNNVNLSHENKKVLNNINFSVNAGQILGVIGVEGNGQAELVNLLTRKDRSYSGDIKVLDKDLKTYDYDNYRKEALAYIPEDRMNVGISESLSVADNLLSTRYRDKTYSNKFFLKKDAINSYSKEIIDDYEIIVNGPDQVVGYISGGNIQKVVVGRECYDEPKFLLCEQPTRGVDLGAAKIIHNKLIELRNQGTAILLISADINEVLKISDRALVMYNGEIVASIDDMENIDISEIGEYMLGLKVQA